MDIVDRLSVLGGAARARDFVRSRPDRRELDNAVELGTVTSMGSGWYALSNMDAALAHATRFGAVVTCVSAARFYELPVAHGDSRIHLSIGGGRGCPPAAKTRAFLIHRQKRGGPGPGSEVPIAPVAEALALALSCTDPVTAIGMVDAARHKGLTSKEEIRALLRGPGSLAARARLEHTSGSCRSVGETAMRLALRSAGLEVREGVEIPGVGEVDLLVEDCVIVECDGVSYHSDPAAFAEDRRRDRAAQAAGYVPLRFPHRDIFGALSPPVEEVLTVLDRVQPWVRDRLIPVPPPQ